MHSPIDRKRPPNVILPLVLRSLIRAARDADKRGLAGYGDVRLAGWPVSLQLARKKT
jgi:hypothetical protein